MNDFHGLKMIFDFCLRFKGFRVFRSQGIKVLIFLGIKISGFSGF
jgi:hypothetical protein